MSNDRETLDFTGTLAALQGLVGRRVYALASGGDGDTLVQAVGVLIGADHLGDDDGRELWQFNLENPASPGVEAGALYLRAATFIEARWEHPDTLTVVTTAGEIDVALDE